MTTSRSSSSFPLGFLENVGSNRDILDSLLAIFLYSIYLKAIKKNVLQRKKGNKSWKRRNNKAFLLSAIFIMTFLKCIFMAKDLIVFQSYIGRCYFYFF